MRMFLVRLKQLKNFFLEDAIFFSVVAFCILLPFQFALNPRAGFDVAVVRLLIPLLFFSWLFLKIKAKQTILINTKLTCLIFAFLLLALFSISFSQNVFWSLRKFFFFLSIFPIYFVSLSVFNSAKKKRLVIFSLVIGGAMLSLIAIIQFVLQFIFGIDAVYAFLANNVSSFFLGNSFSKSVLTYPSWLVSAGGSTYMRAVAMFPDPHMLSYYLEMLIPWSIALWALAKKQRGWLLVSAVFLIIADVLTFTRGSYVALIAGAMIILPLVTKKTVSKILLGAGLFALLLLLAPHNPVADRFASSFDVQEGSNQGRLNNWQQALEIISAHPFGVGIGSYSLSVKPTATYREPIYAHNTYLDVAAELGIITMLVFVAIVFFALKSFWIMSKTDPFFIAGVSSVAIFATHSLVENPLYSVHVLPLLLIILALSASRALKPTQNIYEKNIDLE